MNEGRLRFEKNAITSARYAGEYKITSRPSALHEATGSEVQADDDFFAEVIFLSESIVYRPPVQLFQ